MNNKLEIVEEKINSYTQEEILELRKILLGYDDADTKWELIMNTLYASSKESIKTVQKSELLTYFFELFKNTIYEEEMLLLFGKLDDSVDRVLRKMDSLYLEACQYLESLLYLRSLSDNKLESPLSNKNNNLNT